MNIKDEHTSRLWTFILKGEIMDLDESELIATRVNNKVASWKEVEEYIEKYYVKKDKIKEKIKELEQKIHVVTPDTHIIEKINELKNEGALNILEELLGE